VQRLTFVGITAEICLKSRVKQLGEDTLFETLSIYGWLTSRVKETKLTELDWTPKSTLKYHKAL